MILGLFIKFLAMSGQMAIPILINYKLKYIVDPGRTVEEGVQLLVLIIIVKLITIICIAHSQSLFSTLGQEFGRILSLSLTEKCMKLVSISNGAAINLLTVDLYKIQSVTQQIANMIFMPIQFAVAIFLMYEWIGISFIAGLVVVITASLLNFYMGSCFQRFQSSIMTAKDKRTKLTNELFNQIKYIKVNALEEHFVSQIEKLRADEIRSIGTKYLITQISGFTAWVAPSAIVLSTFAWFIYDGNVLNSSVAFSLISLFLLIQEPLFNFPSFINSVIDGNVSLKRIQESLSQKELQNQHITFQNHELAIEIINGNYFWKQEIQQPKNNNKQYLQVSTDEVDSRIILKNVNLKIHKGRSICIVGEMGSGKSSLFSAILGEMIFDVKKYSPQINIDGKIAFVSQKPWLLNSSVKENIMFGQDYNEELLKKVIYFSCLENDVESFPQGTETLLGEKGVNLSGGQKARLSLARALYSQATIFLLDDPISAVDTRVGNFIIKECLNGWLKGTTRVMITHALNYCSQFDEIIQMQDGCVVAQGTFEEVKQNQIFSNMFNKQIQIEVKDSSEVGIADETVEKKVNEKVEDIMLKEQRIQGSIQGNFYLQFIKRFGGSEKNIFLQIGFSYLFLLIFVHFLFIADQTVQNLWLTYWTSKADRNEQNIDSVFCLNIYTLLSIIFAMFSVICCVLIYMKQCSFAEMVHNDMLNTVVYAPLCSFFERVSSGQIINRLTKDLNVLDQEIGFTIFIVFIQILFLVENSFLSIYSSTVYILIPLVFYLVLSFMFQRLYMGSNRELTRLEGVTKSPIISFFTECVNGLSTIRVFNQQEQFLIKLSQKLDTNYKVNFLKAHTDAWFSMILALSSLLVNISAIGYAIFSDSNNAAFAGIILTFGAFIDINVQWLVVGTSMFEGNMISFERCLQYTMIQTEKQSSQNKIDIDWPSQGKIEFVNFSVQYREGLSPALKNINLQINAREKIGVVGRTGAGKSTMTLVLLRILEALEGTILIDGVDISQIPLKSLRSKLTKILQEAAIFQGTLRYNLDPLNFYKDDELIQVAKECCLEDFLTQRSGLDTEIQEGGSNLSAGEKQLICIARAILKKSKIVLIDEATANIDLQTEILIQETIQKAFKLCTVIIIAHRINTIMHCDKQQFFKIKFSRIIVMEGGEIKEYGETQQLLSNPNSTFSQIVQEVQKDVRK